MSEQVSAESSQVASNEQSVRHCVRSNTQRELSVANHYTQRTAVLLCKVEDSFRSYIE